MILADQPLDALEKKNQRTDTPRGIGDMRKILEAQHLCKTFNGKTVLNEINFQVEEGEIFGLLGPNGAGKTTMIRIILDILKPDSGMVHLFGRQIDEKTKELIGYLPEERGLYPKIAVFRCLKYFAELKGIKDPKNRIDFWLEKIGLLGHKNKKVGELSKGMQQEIQFLVSVLHDPDFIILDEPFVGLDPINTKVIKDILLELKSKGRTVILSTHQIDQVEKMCDRILMINKGKSVLYGSLENIKAKYSKSIKVEFKGELKRINGVKKISNYGKYAELTLSEEIDPQVVLKSLTTQVEIRKFEISAPSLNEIFIDVAQR